MCDLQKVNVPIKNTSHRRQAGAGCKQCTAMVTTRPQFTLGDVRSHSLCARTRQGALMMESSSRIPNQRTACTRFVSDSVCLCSSAVALCAPGRGVSRLAFTAGSPQQPASAGPSRQEVETHPPRTHVHGTTVTALTQKWWVCPSNEALAAMSRRPRRRVRICKAFINVAQPGLANCDPVFPFTWRPSNCDIIWAHF